MIWMPMTVFGCCALAQFWFMHRIASALQGGHLELYRRMYGLFAMQRLIWFALFRGDRRLDDAELSKRTKHLQWLYLIGLASWVWFVVLLLNPI